MHSERSSPWCVPVRSPPSRGSAASIPRPSRGRSPGPEHEASVVDFDTAARIVYPDRAYVPAKLRAFIDCLKGR